MIADPAAFENLNVQRVIRAPRERVFRAWTNPDDILKLWTSTVRVST
jgi:uncharacterized protein YndB with AHSA1/START domain